MSQASMYRSSRKVGNKFSCNLVASLLLILGLVSVVGFPSLNQVSEDFCVDEIEEARGFTYYNLGQGVGFSLSPKKVTFGIVGIMQDQKQVERSLESTNLATHLVARRSKRVVAEIVIIPREQGYPSIVGLKQRGGRIFLFHKVDRDFMCFLVENSLEFNPDGYLADLGGDDVSTIELHSDDALLISRLGL